MRWLALCLLLSACHRQQGVATKTPATAKPPRPLATGPFAYESNLCDTSKETRPALRDGLLLALELNQKMGSPAGTAWISSALKHLPEQGLGVTCSLVADGDAARTVASAMRRRAEAALAVGNRDDQQACLVAAYQVLSHEFGPDRKAFVEYSSADCSSGGVWQRDLVIAAWAHHAFYDKNNWANEALRELAMSAPACAKGARDILLKRSVDIKRRELDQYRQDHGRPAKDLDEVAVHFAGFQEANLRPMVADWKAMAGEGLPSSWAYDKQSGALKVTLKGQDYQGVDYSSY